MIKNIKVNIEEMKLSEQEEFELLSGCSLMDLTKKGLTGRRLAALIFIFARREDKNVTFEECLEYDFVGLNRGSSLLELTSRSAEKLGKQMRLRIQVRSYDAMCQMIAANLGIGVLPIQACAAQIQAMGLAAITLKESWAKRNLLLASREGATLSPPATLLREHLLLQCAS